MFFNKKNKAKHSSVAEYFIRTNFHKMTDESKVSLEDAKNKTNLGRLYLNKYIHLFSIFEFISRKESQVKFEAHTNGAVTVNDAYYAKLKFIVEDGIQKNESVDIADEDKYLAESVNKALENINYEDLIEILHEDKNWIMAAANKEEFKIKESSPFFDKLYDEFKG